MKKILSIISVLVILAAAFVSRSDAQTIQTERITNYASEITVKEDRSMTVNETITVYAAGDTIKRGIYRDFPTKYKDRFGNTYLVGFEVLGVTKDGLRENYVIENMPNGKRVRIGNANVFLEPGIYTYSISYKTNNQLGFFENHDELYWNVTGNGWNYVIGKATAVVNLPPSIPAESITAEAYTGAFGSTGKNYVSHVTGSSIYFETTEVLNQNEGLTIVTSWPKGFVPEPTQNEKLMRFLRENINIIYYAIALVFIFVFYFVMWSRFGRDPKRGTIIPQYEPPQNFAPAEMRFHSLMRYDKTTLASAVLSMAVKGYITIEETESKILFIKSTLYTLQKKERADSSKLSPVEQRFAGQLFAGREFVTLTKTNAEIMTAEVTIMKALKETIDSKYIVRNARYIGIGITVSAIIIAIGIFAFNPSIFVMAFIILVMLANIIFAPLLKRRTAESRRLQDETEGFKWFLSVTEKDRMNFHNPPEKTPELFEKFLPYALALGVQNKWAEQFSKVFEMMAQQGRAYSPMWYAGAHFNSLAIASFTSNFSSSFATAISSSTTVPGSGSGSGGGGSSGGGGGGGGGGGW